MFSLFKKAVLAGLGLQARANDLLEEWVKEGERNPRKEAKWVRDVLARVEKEANSVEEKCEEVYKKALSWIDLPSREELNRVSKKVDDLVNRLKTESQRSSKT